MARQLRHRAGLSLIEILIACIILAFAMIPIAAMMGSGFRGTMRDSRQIKALQLCQARLNQCHNVPFDRLVTTASNITSGTTVLLNLGPENIDNTVYTVDLVVADVPVNFSFQSVDVNQPGYNKDVPTSWVFQGAQTLSIPVNAARRATVRVSWTERPGVPQQQVSFSTFRVNLDY